MAERVGIPTGDYIRLLKSSRQSSALRCSQGIHPPAGAAQRPFLQHLIGVSGPSAAGAVGGASWQSWAYLFTEPARKTRGKVGIRTGSQLDQPGQHLSGGEARSCSAGLLRRLLHRVQIHHLNEPLSASPVERASSRAQRRQGAFSDCRGRRTAAISCLCAAPGARCSG